MKMCDLISKFSSARKALSRKIMLIQIARVQLTITGNYYVTFTRSTSSSNGHLRYQTIVNFCKMS